VSFVSRTLLSRLLSRQPLRASEHRDEEGAVLLSDIEGFTAMVERFSQPGAAGVEAIASALNGYLADVVEIVNRYAGDVIAIAGDSVLCFWKATGDLSLEEACAHAGQAALAIQSALHERETAHDLFFRTRIGIGSGPVTLSFVGGFNGRWECLLSGPALDAAVNAERIASAGEVILAHGAAALLDPFGCHESARQGHRRLLTMAIPPPSLPPPTQEAGATQDVLAPFLPRALLSRLDLPSATWLPEFRLVTLFLATVTTHSAESALCTGPLIASFFAFRRWSRSLAAQPRWISMPRALCYSGCGDCPRRHMKMMPCWRWRQLGRCMSMPRESSACRLELLQVVCSAVPLVLVVVANTLCVAR
jgi:class 3 adenylate cyclase